MKVCKQDMTELVDMQVATFNIAGFSFIESLADGLLYEQRKEIVHRGLRAISESERKCDEEWCRSQTLVTSNCAALFEVIKRAYQEMLDRGKEEYQDAKQKLQASRQKLEKLLAEKHFHLSSLELAVIEKLPAATLFRLVVGDCRVTVVKTLLTHFHLLSPDRNKLETLVKEQSLLGHVNIANEVSLYARDLGFPFSDFQQAARKQAKQVEEQISNLLYFREIETQCLSAGLFKIQSGDYDGAIQDLQTGMTRLNQRALQNSELWLQLGNTLAESYFQMMRYADCEKECEKVLSSWGRQSNSCELWRAVFFLELATLGARLCSSGGLDKEAGNKQSPVSVYEPLHPSLHGHDEEQHDGSGAEV